MNAAEQRRLTPLLGAACAMAALVLVAFVLGIGRGVHWDAAGKAAALPKADAVARRAAPPLQQFADVWQHPLFTTDRQPAPEADSGGGNVTLGDLQLTGIIITPGLRMALLHGRSGDDSDVRVREGESVGNSGWTLTEVKPRSAVFSRNGQRTELNLVVAGDRGDSVAPAPDSGHDNGNGKANATPRGNSEPARKVIPARAVHPERAAALRMRSPAQGRQADPARDQAEQERLKREEALKARIKSRRQQMQAQQEQEH